VARYTLTEDVVSGMTDVRCEVRECAGATPIVIEASGVGPIDALFKGLRAHYAREFQSLNSIAFSSFAVTARLDTGRAQSATDSVGEVELEVRNSDGERFRFAHLSRSITRSGIEVTLKAVEYFVNSEKAYTALYHAWMDAKSRGRHDLVGQFTCTMARLVQNTSYSDVIARIRQEMG
jgi:predicted transcriptional regulator